MAIIQHILISEIQGLDDSLGNSNTIDETMANACETEASNAISNFGSIPAFIQHQLAIYAHFGTISAATITAAVAEDWDALRSAISADSGLDAKVKDYLWLRMGTVVGSEFDHEATHN
tara:strand:+ start:304 stop:657 length:354 start_codon:yes stop_codon:yes gene_type:complete